MCHICQKISCPITFFFLVIVTSLLVLHKLSHLKIERNVKIYMFYLTNVWQLGARLDLM